MFRVKIFVINTHMITDEHNERIHSFYFSLNSSIIFSSLFFFSFFINTFFSRNYSSKIFIFLPFGSEQTKQNKPNFFQFFSFCSISVTGSCLPSIHPSIRLFIHSFFYFPQGLYLFNVQKYFVFIIFECFIEINKF